INDITLVEGYNFLCRNKFYTSIFPEIEVLLQSLFKETIEGCTILCEFVSKISWAEYSQEETCSLSEVCENLSEIAHCFSCLSEVKISVIAWKTYASLIQNYNEEIKRDIVLVPTVGFLYEEIEEGIQMMKSFGKSPELKLVKHFILMFLVYILVVLYFDDIITYFFLSKIFF
ncbi:hypothetical protein Anas_06314, partial [Armadillidium nasatum]